MKKWKLLFISIAIVMGIGGAFASSLTNCRTCKSAVQFIPWNGTFVYAGEEGVDYACVGGAGICTYYKPGLGSPYLPCQFGFYYPIYDDELHSKK
ncbi:hypothetical protein A4H97_31260 [Niastella yeongjuensis]|uniref:Secreted protein n=1 Tax=Niastella yeongjuensis TaxID=354355 RepID=A0A1V9EJD8_9BACT|nr:DUF6520 family protein [Niastella yeongjuensis]OQP46243.1 hypothetical protein A4H97_31260 [Niastella yeongjuensis]SEP46112.1 hypothetical protein SAMN05660816_06409 [Niastella yeongjuensis]